MRILDFSFENDAIWKSSGEFVVIQKRVESGLHSTHCQDRLCCPGLVDAFEFEEEVLTFPMAALTTVE